MGAPMKKSLQEATTPYAYSPLPLDDNRSDLQTETDTLNEEIQGNDKASIDSAGAYPVKCPQCPPTAAAFTPTNVPGTPFFALANAKITIHAPDGIKSHYIDDKTVVCDIGPRGSVTVCAGGPSPVNPATLFNAAYSPEGLRIGPASWAQNGGHGSFSEPGGDRRGWGAKVSALVGTVQCWFKSFLRPSSHTGIAAPTEMSETKIV
ncbi:unnamed protein product [Cyclocybe aegerita]|uniref:Uncharacterized protein n=1 Tax=Cyclocybe aegerita TaxID=1973307 RepID=A0A8S0W445_CYCAE|nr:unnamed protein product [Cyclocybe aegerita]